MSFLKNNIAWIAPTAAILFVGVGLLDREVGIGYLLSGEGELQADEDASASRVALLNDTVLAALEAPEAVTRNAPVDLLTPAVQAQQPSPAAFVSPARPVTPTQSETDQQNAVAFFNDAQSRLAVADACGEDLKALAAQARVYFPSGAASGDDAGLNAARLIGLVAQDCPGFTVQVLGHSDASGDPDANLKLSEQRAQAVIKRIGASGVDTTRFVAVGLGDTQPSGVRGDQESAFYDRRVEFSIVETVQEARFTPQAASKSWRTALPACAENLTQKANMMRQFYTPGSITMPSAELEAIYGLAEAVAACDGARLRLVGQHEDQPGSREGPSTGRLRALAMMSWLVTAGYPSDQILIGAPSWSVDVPGQPGLPNSRVDFQIIAD